MYSERFQNAIERLAAAYNNGEVSSKDCTRSPVGLIVGGHCWTFFFSTIRNGKRVMNFTNFWDEVSNAETDREAQNVASKIAKKHSYDDVHLLYSYVKTVASYPYTILELCEIEYAFEKNTSLYKGFDDIIRRKSTGKECKSCDAKDVLRDHFDGLMAVLDILFSFETEEHTQAQKNKIRKKFFPPEFS